MKPVAEKASAKEEPAKDSGVEVAEEQEPQAEEKARSQGGEETGVNRRASAGTERSRRPPRKLRPRWREETGVNRRRANAGTERAGGRRGSRGQAGRMTKAKRPSPAAKRPGVEIGCRRRMGLLDGPRHGLADTFLLTDTALSMRGRIFWKRMGAGWSWPVSTLIRQLTGYHDFTGDRGHRGFSMRGRRIEDATERGGIQVLDAPAALTAGLTSLSGWGHARSAEVGNDGGDGRHAGEAGGSRTGSHFAVLQRRAADLLAKTGASLRERLDKRRRDASSFGEGANALQP